MLERQLAGLLGLSLDNKISEQTSSLFHWRLYEQTHEVLLGSLSDQLHTHLENEEPK